jgi:hypothetical protein
MYGKVTSCELELLQASGIGFNQEMMKVAYGELSEDQALAGEKVIGTVCLGLHSLEKLECVDEVFWEEKNLVKPAVVLRSMIDKTLADLRQKCSEPSCWDSGDSDPMIVAETDQGP